MANGRSKFTAGDWVAIILALTLAAALLITVIAIVIFNKDLTESGARLLTTIGAGLVGALSVYIGRTIAKNGHKSDEE
jgi:hypothetical protein